MVKSPKRHVASFRSTAMRTMFIIVVPLFAAITLFNIYTVRNQREIIRSSRLSTLSAYQSQIENTVQLAEAYLQNTAAVNLDFQSIVYAKTKTEAYSASEMVAKNLRPLLQANDLLGGFYTYSKAFDYYRPNNLVSYPSEDAAVIREAVVAAAGSGSTLSGWQPLLLSDRTVLLATAVFRETAAAVVIDPGKQSISDLEDGGVIFSVLPDGSLYTPSSAFVSVSIPPAATGGYSLFQNSEGQKYDAVSLPLSRIGGYVIYAVPYVPPFQPFSLMQTILILVTVCLLAAIPIYWLAFRRLLLEPLNSLTDTMHAIQNGDTNIRVPQGSRLQEVNEIAATVNIMLDTLRQQKISFYEQQLETQHAQLQYLQLQIRPHFYLNCLNIIYSMAEEKNCAAVQELVLNLSSYLRSIFQDSSKLVPLSAELRSAESYVRIQQVSMQHKPNLKLDLDAEVTEALIPPLSILTFVENSFKHSKLMDAPLEIHIKCGTIFSEDRCWLNITVCDNCGGVSQDQLRLLNSAPEEMYREKQVGIFNVKQRLHLLYGDNAMLSFRNQADGICVELFLPMT